MLKCKYIFRIKYTEAILPNITRKLLRCEITKMTIAVLQKQIYRVVYYRPNFRHTFVPYSLLRHEAASIIQYWAYSHWRHQLWGTGARAPPWSLDM